MDKYLKSHIKLIEDKLKKPEKGIDWRDLLEFHRARIGFLQHERLIHLLITLFFGLLFILLVLAVLAFGSVWLTLLVSLVAIMLVAYVWHYYLLENGVQKLYLLDGEICKKIKN
jgi:Flp pilus assembly protein TadB